jgi:hypothetical protein
MFYVPPNLVPEVNGIEKIRFLRPTKEDVAKLGANDIVAARCNETYKGRSALMEGERRYVRQALLRANYILVYKCSGKNPIVIMQGFEAESIINQNGRTIDAAKDRVRFIYPPKFAQAELTAGFETNVHLFRVIGSKKDIESIWQNNPTSSPIDATGMKEHHIKGLFIAHMWLTSKQLHFVRDRVSVERMDHIVDDIAMTRQITIRTTGQNSDVYQLARAVQKKFPKSLTSVRTYGTVRVTLAEEATHDVINKVRAALPAVRIFTDTPLNVWARDSADADRPAAPPRKVKPTPAGKKIVKIAADYLPHPSHFHAVAKHIGGELHNVGNNSYTPVSMTGLVAVPIDTKLPEKSAVAMPGGIWYVTAPGITV